MNEMILNEKFHVRLFVVDCDKNKMHLCMEIYSLFQEQVIAVVEQVLLNVNLKLRKCEPYPPWAFERLIKLKNTHKNASITLCFWKIHRITEVAKMIIKLILTFFCWIAVLPIIYGLNFGERYIFFLIFTIFFIIILDVYIFKKHY
jgi:hypothetical protein